MHRITRYAAAALIALTAAFTATTAVAAPPGWTRVDVTQQTEQQQSMLLVSGELPESTRLPFETELALPAGTELQWVGEILGGDPANDPAVTYKKTTVNGMDVYRFTLRKSRIAQIEGVVPQARGFDGTAYSSALKWTAWTALPEVRISERLPQGAQIAQPAEGASIQPGEAQYSYYTKTVKDVKAGAPLDLTFSYTMPAAGAASSAAGSGSTSPVLYIFLAVMAGGLAFIVFRVNAKMSAKAGEREAQAAPRKTVRASEKEPAKEQAEPEPEPAPARKAKPIVPVLAVVGMLIGGFLIAGSQGTTAKAVNGTVTKSFGAASPCTSASIPIMPKPGVDLSEVGVELVDAYTGHEGVGDVTLDIASSTVDVTFCASSQTEDTMRQVLAATGLVDLGAAAAASAPVTATIDASGKRQSASFDTANGSFNPGTVILKAGVPAEISFGAADGCVTEVIFSGLDLEQKLSTEPSVVKLPALEPGTYEFACAMGHQTGSLVVE